MVGDDFSVKFRSWESFKSSLLPRQDQPWCVSWEYTAPGTLSTPLRLHRNDILTPRLWWTVQRPSPDEDDANLNGHFWKDHRRIDNILLNTSLSLPSHLRLPAGITNAGTVFLNMSLHAGTICLHQDAIFKAESLGFSASLITESKSRCFTAATEICSIMKSIAHVDLSFVSVWWEFLVPTTLTCNSSVYILPSWST